MQLSTPKKERTFKKEEVLGEMLYLRLHGWSLKELAFKYGCRHTSVRMMCIKYGVPNKLPLLPEPHIIFHTVHIDFDGERINRGKNYREYLEESKKRGKHIHRYAAAVRLPHATYAERKRDNARDGENVPIGEESRAGILRL